MTRPRLHARRLRDERGFTVVELMTAMTIMLLIAFAGLTAFEAFDRGAARNSRLTDAEDNSRRNVATMVRILRDAGAPAPTSGPAPASVLRASGNDLVFRSTSWPGESGTGATGTHLERLCLNSATRTVYFDGLRAGTNGSQDPGTACPSTAAGWTNSVIARNVVNTAALPLFRLGSSPVRSVGIQLRTDTGGIYTARSLSLHSGGTLRGALPPQVTEDQVEVDCDEDGPGKALLSLDAAGDYELTTTGAIQVGPAQVLVDVAASATAQVALTVTNPLGLQTLLFKDVTCP